MDPTTKAQFALAKAQFKAEMDLVKAKSELRKQEIEIKKEAFKGNDGYTPIKGKDYFTKEEIESISKDIFSLIPKPKNGLDAVVDYEKILNVVFSKIDEKVSKIPTQKGLAGPKGDKGEDGKTPVIDIKKLTKEILTLIKNDKSFSVDYQNIFKELEKQVHRMRETMVVGSSNSLRGLIDADLTGVPQNERGTYMLGQIGGGSGGGAVDSVNGQTGVVVLDADDISDTSTTKKFTTASDISKLAGIEAEADVTDTVNVTAAGALMDSEVTNLAQVKSFSSADYATAAQGTLASTAVQPAAIANFETTTQLNTRDTNNRARANHTGTQASSTISDFNSASDARIAAAAGVSVASLSGGKIPTSQLPALALTDVFTVASQVAQLALTAEEGDVAIRTDQNKSYIHNGGVAGTMADWSELLTPTDTVLSVNGEVGSVTLSTDDISDSGQTNKWATAAEKTKLGFIAVTQAVDLDTIESDTATNNAKVSNATHTGEVIGATTLTVDKTAITNKTLVTAAVGDHILVADASDSDNLKKVTVQTIVNLASSGGISDGDKGDITVSAAGTVWEIDSAVVGVTKLSATGTPSATTFLRGDNTWATPAGGGGASSRSSRMGWVFPDSTIDPTADITANKWHTISAMWYELESDGDFLKRDTVAFGTNFYYTAANALTVRENSTVALVNISSGNATGVNALTASPTKRLALITEMLAFCKANNFDGVDLDLETFQTASMTVNQYSDFKVLLKELGTVLHNEGLILSIEVPPIWNITANTESGSGDAWDSAASQGYYRLRYEDLNDLPVDRMVIMAYDYQYDYSAGEPNQPLKWLKEILEFARVKINEDKIQIVAGLPSAGYSGATGGYSITGRTYDYLSVQTGFSGASRDANSGELIWANAGTSYAAIDDTAIGLKVAQAEAVGIFAHALWHIGNNQYGAADATTLHPDNRKLNVQSPVTLGLVTALAAGFTGI